MKKVVDILGVNAEWLLYGEEGATGTMSLHEAAARVPAGADATETPALADDPLREKCREYFEEFLGGCRTRAQLGWLYYELMEHFPAGKFSRGAPPAPPASLKPPSAAQEILKSVGERYDDAHRHSS